MGIIPIYQVHTEGDRDWILINGMAMGQMSQPISRRKKAENPHISPPVLVLSPDLTFAAWFEIIVKRSNRPY